MEQTTPITLLICALGGEGGGVLTEWLVDTARHAGYACQSTSIPGVAQRTGATTYYIEVFPVPLAQLEGRRPVFSLNPVPGALDAIVSSELLETTRQIGAGMSSPDRTVVITSSGRTFTTQERMQLADGRSDSAELLGVVQAFSREHCSFDMAALAQEAGTVVSAVMLGAIAGSGLFPFERADYESVVRAGGGKSADASLRGFARGFEIVREQDACHPGSTVAHNGCHPGLDPGSMVEPPDGLRVKPAMTGFPAEVHDILALGHARMLEYQGAAYAQLYLQRLRAVLAAERAADPLETQGFATTREMARWLALWMAFDDIVRVADLKSRAGRWQRVKGEVKAGDDDLLRVYDYFKPGAPEIAALLPAALAERLLRWDRRRVLRGKAPWALPVKVAAHSVAGMLALRTLAALKWLRVRGSRYANEQAMLGKWLDGVIEGSRRDWRLGHEIALCGRLIKGYGATNERGKENLLHVLDHLAKASSAPAAAQAIAAARNAALADEAGQALDAVLVQHGAPARPVKAQPIRWMRKPKPQGS
ncbi:MAG TPA: indolepyruvate oxidoreductase subunit beta family protein [Ramlibacter sp.]|nr:indolepyruvate oxidoreductase subunit beta family protein [Ramlibacter sp.]